MKIKKLENEVLVLQLEDEKDCSKPIILSKIKRVKPKYVEYYVDYDAIKNLPFIQIFKERKDEIDKNGFYIKIRCNNNNNNNEISVELSHIDYRLPSIRLLDRKELI